MVESARITAHVKSRDSFFVEFANFACRNHQRFNLMNMKRIRKSMMLLCITVMSIIAGTGMLASCSSNDNPSGGDTTSEKADLVVYGKIFTSENNKVVEAFAVKDGKYIYVGDKKGAEAYVEAGKTRWWTILARGL